MTKTEMKDHLARRLSVITGGKVEVAEAKVDLDTCIDVALDNLWLRYPWNRRNDSDTITTTSGDSLYSLASDVAHLKALNYGDDNNEILIKSREWVNHALSGITWTGFSGIWYATIEGEDSDGYLQIQLHPVPSAAWTVNYWYLKKLAVSYEQIPFPSVVLLGAIATWKNGSPDGDLFYENAVDRLIQSDEPYVGVPARWPTDMHIERQRSYMAGLR